jgi:hypothetical protein
MSEHCPGCRGTIEPEYLRPEPCPGLASSSAPAGLARCHCGRPWDEHDSHYPENRDRLASAPAPAGLDGLDPVIDWVERQQNTPWAESWSQDFRHGYDTAVEEVDRIVSYVRAAIRPAEDAGERP